MTRILENNPFVSLTSQRAVDENSQRQTNQRQSNQKATNRQANQQAIPRKEKVPPLFTSSKEGELMRKDLAAKQIHPLFKNCLTGTKIVCSTFDDYHEVIKYLNQKNLEFYTHDAPGTKPLKVIIHGLTKHTPDELMEELKAVKLKPLQVFPIKRAEGKQYRDLLYLVHLEKGSISMAELHKVRALFQTIVEWERYRPKKKDVTQCYNCLMYGHGTRNCSMAPRCARCAGPHLTQLCLLMEENAEPKCANCDANHEASSRTCPKRAEFMAIRKKASAKNQHGRNRRDPPPPPPMNEENFPRYRHVVPNLKPLEPHRQASWKPPAHDRQSVQPRFAAAAATPSVTNTPPPGWGNHERRSPAVDPLDDGTLFPTKLMSQLAITLFERLLASRSKREQINAVVTTVEDFVDRYGP